MIDSGSTLRDYLLYGLRLRTPLALACRETALGGAPDVMLLPEDPEERPRAEFQNPGNIFWHYGQEQGWDVIRLRDTCQYRVAPDRRSIRYCRAHGVSLEALRSYLLAAPLSFVLLTRNIEPLHATAVTLNGAVVAFMGDSGYGKSSLAAALVSQGHCLVTDDLLVLDLWGEPVRAYPSPRHIKLFPRDAQRLLPGLRGAALNPHTDKQVYQLPADRVCEEAAAVRLLYKLEDPNLVRTTSLEIVKLPPAQAFPAILRHLFNDDAEYRARLGPQFEFCRRLAASVPVFSVACPRKVNLIEDFARELMSHAASVEPGSVRELEQRAKPAEAR